MICNFNVFPSFKLDRSRSSSSKLGTKALGFIDNKNDPSVLLGFLNQKLREDIIGLDRIQLSFAQPEGKQNPGQEMFNVVARVRDKTDRMLRPVL